MLLLLLRLRATYNTLVHSPIRNFVVIVVVVVVGQRFCRRRRVSNRGVRTVHVGSLHFSLSHAPLTPTKLALLPRLPKPTNEEDEKRRSGQAGQARQPEAFLFFG